MYNAFTDHFKQFAYSQCLMYRKKHSQRRTVMAFEFLLNAVYEEPSKRYVNGTAPAPGDTICFICSENGSVYKGYNTHSNGENIHAEVNAVNSLKADGQSMIRAITVMDSYTGSTIIPCTGCLNMLLSVDYRNINTVIATPTGNIPITQFLGHQAAACNTQMNMNSRMLNENAGYASPSGRPNAPIRMNQAAAQFGTYTNPAGFRNSAMHMNQNPASMYMGGMNPAVSPVYTSPNGTQVRPAGSGMSSLNSSVYTGNMSGMNSGIGQKSYSSGSGKKSSVLRNKLNSLLDDEE